MELIDKIVSDLRPIAHELKLTACAYGQYVCEHPKADLMGAYYLHRHSAAFIKLRSLRYYKTVEMPDGSVDRGIVLRPKGSTWFTFISIDGSMFLIHDSIFEDERPKTCEFLGECQNKELMPILDLLLQYEII